MKNKRINYPCIVEVSRSKDFSENDPYLRRNRVQVCIGKICEKYICIESKEEHVSWMLEHVKNGIRSGGISGLVLGFWEYAREIKVLEFPKNFVISTKQQDEKMKELFEKFKKDCPSLIFDNSPKITVTLDIICPYSEEEREEGLKEMHRNLLLLKADSIVIPELEYLVEIISKFNNRVVNENRKAHFVIDLDKLKFCKTFLAYTNEEYTEAILAIIDNLQDQIVDNYKIDKYKVFYFTDTEDEEESENNIIKEKPRYIITSTGGCIKKDSSEKIDKLFIESCNKGLYVGKQKN